MEEHKETPYDDSQDEYEYEWCQTTEQIALQIAFATRHAFEAAEEYERLFEVVKGSVTRSCEKADE